MNRKIVDLKIIVKPILLLAFLYTLAISPILRGNINYIDDMGRVREGYNQWDGLSRFLAYFASNLLHTDSYLADISPLPQLLSAVLMAIASVLLLSIISEKKDFLIREIVSVIPLALSPYFMECFSYKYDSVYMALSVLLAIIPFQFRKSGALKYGLISFGCMLAISLTYQTSIGIYPMLVFFLVYKEWNQKGNIKEILQFVGSSVIGSLFALLLFKQFLMQEIYMDYTTTEMISIDNMFPIILHNYQTFFGHILTDFRIWWLIMIGLMLVSFIFLGIQETKQNKIVAALATMATIIMMMFMTYSIYPLQVLPSEYPRAMFCVGAFIAVLSVSIVTNEKLYLGKMASYILCWVFFVFAFIYGNALCAQMEYTDFRIEQVIDDLKEIDMINSGHEVTLEVAGTIGYAPVVRQMPDDFQILRRLIPITFRENWYWGDYKLRYYYGITNLKKDYGKKLSGREWPVLVDNCYHTIKGKAPYILVELKEADEQIIY